MARTISDDDVTAIASDVVNLLAKRIMAPPPPPPAARPLERPERMEVSPRLAYTVKQLAQELSISPASIYRLEQRGLLRANPALRTKLYSRASVDRLLALSEAVWRD